MIPSKPLGQDPVSQQLWYISKQLEQLIGITGRIAGSTSTTTSTSTSTTSTTTSTSTSTTSTTTTHL